MKRGYFILIALLACVISGHAQSDMDFILNKEGKVVAVPKFKKFDFNIPKTAYKTYTPSAPSTPPLRIGSNLQDFMPQTWPIEERPMDMQVSSTAYQPFFNVYTPMLRRVSPMALDFYETSITPINKNLSFAVGGQQYTWPGAGGLTRIEPTLVWHSEQWTLMGGAFGGRYYTPFNPSPQLMGGFNAQVKYDMTDRLAFRAWGQYAFFDKTERNNPHMLLNPFYNHTNVGGSMEFMVTDKFGVGMGVNYEFNTRRRAFEPQYMVYPVFKTKNFKIGW